MPVDPQEFYIDMKEAAGDIKFDKVEFYSRFRKPIVKEHSRNIAYINLFYFQENDKETFNKLVEYYNENKVEKPDKEKGVLDEKIYGNKRVYCRRTLGEMHDFNDIPDDLKKILNAYYEVYIAQIKDR